MTFCSCHQQTKGTSSFGKRRNKTHTLCRRCGRSSYHIQKHTCSQCGYPSKRLRHCEYFKVQSILLWPVGPVPSSRIFARWNLCLSYDLWPLCDSAFRTFFPELKTIGVRRPSVGRPPAPAACVTWRSSTVALGTDSRRSTVAREPRRQLPQSETKIRRTVSCSLLMPRCYLHRLVSERWAAFKERKYSPRHSVTATSIR